MRFTIASSVATAYCITTAAATPVDLAERQAGSNSCLGPVVNFFGYTALGCTNAGSTSQLFNVLKFAPLPQTIDKNYQSDCQHVNTPTDTASSFAFTSDGFNLKNCYLVTHSTDDCSGSSAGSKALTVGFSRCFNETVGSAYVFCKPYGTKMAKDLDLARFINDDEGDVAVWHSTF